MAPMYVRTRYAKRGEATLPWHTVAVSRTSMANPVAQCGVEAATSRGGRRLWLQRQWYEIVDVLPEGGKACKKCAVPRCIRCRSEDVRVTDPSLCGSCYVEACERGDFL